MKQGKTLAELGREMQRQRQNRQDFLADTRSLEMKSDSCVSTLRMSLDRHDYSFTVGDNAHQQIASRLNIPYRYYVKMQSTAPDLLDQNVNRWFNQTPERRMIRVLDGNVRAFLSDRYRQLKAEVKVGYVVQAGFVVSNSEVGLGSLRVEPLIFRLVCKNGLICKDLAQKKYHVGRQVNVSDDSAYELYSDETLAQDDKAFFMKVQDVVRCAVDEARFALTVDKLREATQIPLKHDPVKSVELLADKFQLTENERGDILRQLFMGADNSRYGLINAVTAASKIAKSYERATDLERIGGEIMSSFFTCAAYSDIDATIRLDGHVVFLALDDANTSVHITLNPLQVRMLAKYLEIALSQIDFANLLDEQHFGNLTVQIEQNEDNELAAAS